jgi:imidazolonepropionase-like amidohydrolase
MSRTQGALRIIHNSSFTIHHCTATETITTFVTPLKGLFMLTYKEAIQIAPAQTASQCWHIHAIQLPYDDEASDWWVVDGHWSAEPVAGAVDLPGGWLLPGGLVDAHVHLTIDFDQTGLQNGSAALINANLQRQLHRGVLAMRDAGVPPGVWLETERYTPTVLASGRLLAPPGRYHTWLTTPTTPEELIPTALAEVEAGVSWVKFIADFPGPDGNWFAAPANYEPALVAKLVREVHAAGARVLAHTSGPAVADLIAAGVDSIEHGTKLDVTLVEAMADRGIAWTPTLWTITHYVEPLATQPNPLGAYIQAELARLQAALARAAELGVNMLMGTDELGHSSCWRELIKLQEYGLTPRQLLAAASSRARAYLGLPLLEEGARADFVLYDRDPRLDLTTLAKPSVIGYAGALVQEPESWN